MGVRSLACVTALNILTRKFCREKLNIKGKRYSHIIRIFDGKLAKIESKSGKKSKRYRMANVRYKRILDEIYHTTAKRVIEYAKKFPKPIIAIENLSSLKIRGKTKRRRRRLSIWARKRIQRYIIYKALWEGLPSCPLLPYADKTDKELR
jgi:IS605 OrfB family transposase